MEKQCYKCDLVKDVKDFTKDKSTNDGFCAACRSCRKITKRKYYLENKSELMKKQREQRQSVQEWVSQFKKKCEHCIEDHPACLDFHHEGDKEAGISSMINRNKISEAKKLLIIKEIKKCIVLCSNCHRKLHWKERKNNLSVSRIKK